MNEKYPVLLVLFWFLLSNDVFPQLNFYSGYQVIYDDNIYNNYLQTSDWINNLSLGSAYNFENDINNFQIYYEGAF